MAHAAQTACPSLMTHLLFLLLQASHGLSFRSRLFFSDLPWAARLSEDLEGLEEEAGAEEDMVGDLVRVVTAPA